MVENPVKIHAIDLVQQFRSSSKERVIEGEMPAQGFTRIGRAFIIDRSLPYIDRASIEPEQIPENLENLQKAIEAAQAQIENVKENMGDQPIEVALQLEGMINTHEMILPSLQKKIAEKIETSNMNAQDAAMSVLEEYEIKFKDNHVLDDVRALIDRVIRNMFEELGQNVPHPSLEEAPDGCFVIANKLSPSDCIYLVSRNIRGLIIQHGAASGHVAVIAKELGIPSIFTEADIKVSLHDDMPVIIDGQNGIAYLNPTEKTIENLTDKINEEARQNELRARFKGKSITSQDGFPCRVYCNLNMSSSVGRGRENMADGVGMYRTEWLFTSAKEEPSLETQIAAYEHVIQSVDGHSTTFRLLDTEGDKNEDNWVQDADRWELMRNQVRAMMIAASNNDVPARILLPVVRDISELTTIRYYIAETTHEMEEAGIKVPETKLGMMVEIPAPAMEIEDYTSHADFFSIGSNDLIAWTCGQIRNSEAHEAYEDPTNRTVLKLLESIIKTAKDANKPVSLCGRIASNPQYVSLLLGLGLTKFSAGVENILEIKETIEKIDTCAAKQMVEQLKAQPDRAARERILAGFNGKLDQGPAPDSTMKNDGGVS